MGACWLYIYENKARNSVYIGIADSMERVFGKHNAAAEELRDSLGAVILQTVKPFQSRQDARKAEAIAIHIATMGRVTVAGEDDDGIPLSYTNISGTRSTTELGPAIFTKAGTIEWDSLQGTALVPIHADELEGRPAPFGAHPSAIFAERAHQHWSITPNKRPKIVRLMALLTGSGNIILGDWDVAPQHDWKFSADSAPRVAIPLLNPDQDDPRSVKGMRVKGHRMNSGVTYSPDLL